MSKLAWIDDAIQNAKKSFVTPCHTTKNDKCDKNDGIKYIYNQQLEGFVTPVTLVTPVLSHPVKNSPKNEKKSVTTISVTEINQMEGFECRHFIVADIEAAGYVLVLEGDALSWSHPTQYHPTDTSETGQAASEEAQAFQTFIEQYLPIIVMALRERNKGESK